MAKKAGTAGLLRDLLAARDRDAPVRIERGELESGSDQGYVVDASPRLVLLHKVSDHIRLDGFIVFRLEDVTTLRTEWRARRFVERALEMKGMAPGRPAGPIDLSSMRAAVASASAAYPVVVISREETFPGEVSVGRVREESRASFRMHWMGVDARWEWDGDVYRWSEVTRLEFGNEYEETLAMVAAADGSEPPATILEDVARRQAEWAEEGPDD